MFWLIYLKHQPVYTSSCNTCESKKGQRTPQLNGTLGKTQNIPNLIDFTALLWRHDHVYRFLQLEPQKFEELKFTFMQISLLRARWVSLTTQRIAEHMWSFEIRVSDMLAFFWLQLVTGGSQFSKLVIISQNIQSSAEGLSEITH